MNKTNFSYNNEAIATISIGYFMDLNKRIEISKILFLLPFILYEPCLKKLRNTSYKRSLEEFIVKNPEAVMGFNSRFFNYLPLSVNSITILNEAKIINIDGDKLIYNENTSFSPLNKFLGRRANGLFKGIEQLNSIMMSESSASFYLKLKITL